MPAANETVHNRIAMLRVERGISRRQLADALGVHYQTIGYLERDEYSPSLHLALRIAQHFGVPVEVVFSTQPFPLLGSGEAPADGRQQVSHIRPAEHQDDGAAVDPSGRAR